MKRIILASQSPRRKELLGKMGVEFEVVVSNYEEVLDDARDPELVAKELALGKALDVAQSHPDAYVIGADTIVTIDGKQLGKPASPAEAEEMLRLLAGREHYVTTGIAVVSLNNNVRLSAADTTTVFFAPFNEQAVRDYVATGDPMDKAGAYGVQTLYGNLIERVEGDFDAVIGLATKQLARLLQQCGIQASPVQLNPEDLQNHVQSS